MQLTDYKAGTNIHNRNLAVSPDGNTIAFSAQDGGSSPNIWAMDADGSNLRRITSEEVLEEFCWSPDSKYIAFVSFRYVDWGPQNGSLWMINVESKEKHIIFDGRLQ